jgi:hypothetical protein
MVARIVGPRQRQLTKGFLQLKSHYLFDHHFCLVRRSLGQEPELKYHRAWAPSDVPLLKLAQARATRWTIEEDIQSAKGECGLDEYETRGWVGWHHHTTLSMLALAFLTLQRVRLGEKEPQMSVPEVRTLLTHLLEVRVWDVAEILQWSEWRRERNRRAAVSHRKRRLAALRKRGVKSRSREPAL